MHSNKALSGVIKDLNAVNGSDINKLSVGILGAGIAGLSLGLCLKKLGMDVAIYEKTSLSEHIGGGLGIWPNGSYILKELGLIQKAQEISGEVNEVRSKTIAEEKLYSLGLIHYQRFAELPPLFVKRSDIIKLLSSEFCNREIKENIAYDDVIDSGDHVDILLNDGNKVRHDFVVSADGVGSKLRKKLFPKINKKYLGHISMGGVVKNYKPKNNFILGHQKLCVSFPSSGNDSYAILFQPAPVKYLSENLKNRDKQNKYFMGWCHEVDEIISKLGNEFYFCLESYGYQQACLPEFYKGRIAFIGDAAHPLTPMSGMAASLAMEDAYVLAAQLERHINVNLALQKYSCLQRVRAKSFVDFSDKYFVYPVVNESKEEFISRVNYIRQHGPSQLVKALVDITQGALN